jgi:hypothetical protein
VGTEQKRKYKNACKKQERINLQALRSNNQHVKPVLPNKNTSTPLKRSIGSCGGGGEITVNSQNHWKQVNKLFERNAGLQNLTSHLPSPGIIRSTPYSPR